MKKILINSLLIVFIIIFSLAFILSTTGIETNKFNKLISDKASKTNINLELDTVKFKINPKKLSLFLETNNPVINYREILIPVKNIKVYVDFISLLKAEPIIKRSVLELEKLDITELNRLSLMIKPSNFKSFLNNKIKKGKLVSEIEIFLSEQGIIEDFIAKGKINDLKVDLYSNLNFTNGKLDFFADKDDVLIKNIYGNLEEIKISDGDIKLNFEDGIKLKSNFNSTINFDEQLVSKFKKFFYKYKFYNSLKSLEADLNNSISVDLDKTYKIKDYDYSISGIVKKSKLELLQPIKNIIITDEIKTLYLSDLEISTSFQPKNFISEGKGKYSFNNLNYYKLNFDNSFKKNITSFNLDIDYGHSLTFDFINYKKNKNSIANLLLNIEKNSNKIKINKFYFKEDKNLIKLNDLVFDKNKFLSFKKIEIKTTNNDFNIQSGKKIFVKGNKFDATNLVKLLSKNKGENIFKKISNNIEIDFRNIKIPLSEKLQNFKLLGEIKNGEFVKISSKGDFGGNNFLDISMKKDKKSDKKYLEIYSDLTRPLLTEYSFFNGLSGGKLFFTSIIDKSKSNSRLKIENFKIINAPGLIKLLSLADLRGLVDLAEGDGLSFDFLEIEMEKNNNFLKLNEILALGPTMSVLMEGYQDNNGITSLRGTLVPAKTLNKIISKIPIIGNIVIPKEVGEGLFGVSFKMKGPKGKIKTTINPIKTLTPRFIQKIIEKNQTK